MSNLLFGFEYLRVSLGGHNFEERHYCLKQCLKNSFHKEMLTNGIHFNFDTPSWGFFQHCNYHLISDLLRSPCFIAQACTSWKPFWDCPQHFSAQSDALGLESSTHSLRRCSKLSLKGLFCSKIINRSSCGHRFRWSRPKVKQNMALRSYRAFRWTDSLWFEKSWNSWIEIQTAVRRMTYQKNFFSQDGKCLAKQSRQLERENGK